MITIAMMVIVKSYLHMAPVPLMQIFLVEECILNHGLCVLDGGMLKEEAVLVRGSYKESLHRPFQVE